MVVCRCHISMDGRARARTYSLIGCSKGEAAMGLTDAQRVAVLTHGRLAALGTERVAASIKGASPSPSTIAFIEYRVGPSNVIVTSWGWDFRCSVPGRRITRGKS